MKAAARCKGSYFMDRFQKKMQLTNIFFHLFAETDFEHIRK